MHGEMHGRAEPGIGPFAGGGGPGSPQRDQTRRARAAGEEQKPETDDEECQAGDEGHGGLGEERADDVGAGHDEVTENAAKTIRQRPALRLGQGGEGRAQQKRGGWPGEKAHPTAVGDRTRGEMPAPSGERQK
jgi:hypothetical protein